MFNLPPANNSLPVPARKSRKNFLKQQSSLAGASHPEPVARTPLPAGPSNAQFSFTSATFSAEGSSLPTAPVAFSNADNAKFSFTSGMYCTLPAGESSLSAAPVAFGNESKAQFSLNSRRNAREREFFACSASRLRNAVRRSILIYISYSACRKEFFASSAFRLWHSI